MEICDELKKNYGIEQKDKEAHQLKIKELDKSLMETCAKLASLKNSKEDLDHR
jgi:hypothetical protein